MKVALLKDPEVRKRFEQAPNEALPPTTPPAADGSDAAPSDPDVNTDATT
jgi:hypothetical protein